MKSRVMTAFNNRKKKKRENDVSMCNKLVSGERSAKPVLALSSSQTAESQCTRLSDTTGRTQTSF